MSEALLRGQRTGEVGAAPDPVLEAVIVFDPGGGNVDETSE